MVRLLIRSDQIRSDQIRSDQIRSQTYAYEARTLHHLLPITFVFLFCDKEPFLMTLESTDIMIIMQLLLCFNSELL